MTSLTASSEIGGVRLGLLVDSLREVTDPSAPQDVLEGILPCCPSNLNSSDGVLDPVADHAHVQLADRGLVIDPLVCRWFSRPYLSPSTWCLQRRCRCRR